MGDTMTGQLLNAASALTGEAASALASNEARIAELEEALRELDAAYDDDAWNDSSDPRHGDAMNRVVAAVSAARAALGIEVKESDR